MGWGGLCQWRPGRAEFEALYSFFARPCGSKGCLFCEQIEGTESFVGKPRPHIGAGWRAFRQKPLCRGCHDDVARAVGLRGDRRAVRRRDAARIGEHQSRRGKEWQTIDAPTDLAGAIEDAPEDRTVLVDCLTLWLNNLMFRKINIETAIESLEAALLAREAPTVLVSQRSRLRHRAGQCGGAALSRPARTAQPADRRDGRPRGAGGRGIADARERRAMSRSSTTPRPSAIAPRWRSARRCRTPRSRTRRSRRAC